MVWNTIAHPKMMFGGGDTTGDTGSFSPIKFADTHKLSFYDIIVTVSGSADQLVIALVKGDFETLKRMIENNEAVCGVMFISTFDPYGMHQIREDMVSVQYDVDINIIRLVFSDETKTLNLHSDNTITTITTTSPE